MTYAITLDGQPAIAAGFDMALDPQGATVAIIINGMFNVAPGASLVIHGAQVSEFIVQDVKVSSVFGKPPMTEINAKEKEAVVADSQLKLLMYGNAGSGKTTFAPTPPPPPPFMQGQSIPQVIVDEVNDFSTHATDVTAFAKPDGTAIYQAQCSCGWKGSIFRHRQEAAQTEADDHYSDRHATDPATSVQQRPALPLCASYGVLGTTPKDGDDIVITAGEQFGWRGKVKGDHDHLVRSVQKDVNEPIVAAIQCVMFRPDGTRSNGGVPVAQKAEYVRKIVPEVPEFESLDEAEQWLVDHDPSPRPSHVPGQTIQFYWTQRTKEMNEAVQQVMGVTRDLVITGKVLKFLPKIEDTVFPGFKVVTLEHPQHMGEPHIITIFAHRVVCD